MAPSDSDGADIEQLNRNLVALGFNAANITVDDVWQAATTEGVDLLQESLGRTETGILTLGQIVFLPGAQLVTAVDGVGRRDRGIGRHERERDRRPARARVRELRGPSQVLGAQSAEIP